VKPVAVFLLLLLAWCFVTPSVAAAESQAEGWGWYETLGRWINLTILFGGLFYVVRDPLGRFLRSRREGIQREIQGAKQAKAEAEAALAELEKRVAGLDAELAAMRRAAEEEARKERDRILEQAEREARKLVASAGREIEGLSRSARKELRAYAAKLSVDMATDSVQRQLDDAAREKIANRFLKNLEAQGERRPS